MRVLYFILFACFSIQVSSQIPKRYLSSVVRVSSIDEAGMGLIIGNIGDTIYIVTARHVVHNSTRSASNHVSIDFEKQRFDGKVIRLHEELDLALLAVKSATINFPLIRWSSTLRTHMPVSYFQFNSINNNKPDEIYGEIRAIDTETGRLVFEMSDVVSGDSGSPVFSNELFLGIITTNGLVQGISAEKIADVINNEWKLSKAWKLGFN